MKKKIDPIDALFLKVLRSVWFYLGVFVIACLGYYWIQLPTWEDKNKALIESQLNQINQALSSDPLGALEKWHDLERMLEGKKLKSVQLSKGIAKVGSEIDQLPAEVKEELRAREEEKRARWAAKEEAENEEKRPAREAEEKKKKEAELKRKYKNVDPAATDALAALKKLEAYTEVGVTKIKYSEALGDSWGDIKVFVESAKARKEYPELVTLLREAIQLYRDASNSWDDNDQNDVQLNWRLASYKVAEIDVLLNQD